MKNSIIIFALSVCLTVKLNAAAPEQIVAENHNLASQITGAKEYIASKKIVLGAGFRFTANTMDKFIGKINPVLLFSPSDYQTTSDATTYQKPATGGPIVGTIVGEIPVSYDVSSTGGLVINVPIECPAGINGATPQISLNYNSQAGNGLVGKGWNIGGVDAITRGSKNLADDGKIENVTYTSSDPLYYRGQRLIEINDNDNDATTKEYCLKNDPTIKVLADGCTADGPGTFTVYLPNGTVLSYAAKNRLNMNSEEIFVFRIGEGKYISTGLKYSAPTISWHLNKTMDINGNFISYEYSEDIEVLSSTNYQSPTPILSDRKTVKTATNDNFRLSQIAYTGNGTNTPFYEVKFNYSESNVRKDEMFFYLKDGVKKTLNRRLVGIDVNKIGIPLVSLNQYSLSYLADTESNSSLLNKLDKTTNTNAKINPIVFEYNDRFPEKSAELYYSDVSKNVYYQVDMDGDGKLDKVLVPNSSAAPIQFLFTESVDLFSDNKATLILARSVLNSFDLSKGIVGDFNGDGNGDLCLFNAATICFIWTTFENGKFKLNVKELPYVINSEDYNQEDYFWDTDINAYSGDFDGDGIDDLALMIFSAAGLDESNLQGYHLVKLGVNIKTENGLTFPFVSNSYATSNPNNQPYALFKFENSQIDCNVIDFDGDGIDEFLWAGAIPNTVTICKFEKNAAGYQVINPKTITMPSGFSLGMSGDENSRLAIVDINGDGNQDVIYYRHNPKTKRTKILQYDYYSGFQRASQCQINIEKNTGLNVQFCDYDGDGLVDLLVNDWAITIPEENPVMPDKGNIVVSYDGTKMTGTLLKDGRLFTYSLINIGVREELKRYIDWIFNPTGDGYFPRFENSTGNVTYNINRAYLRAKMAYLDDNYIEVDYCNIAIKATFHYKTKVFLSSHINNLYSTEFSLGANDVDFGVPKESWSIFKDKVINQGMIPQGFDIQFLSTINYNTKKQQQIVSFTIPWQISRDNTVSYRSDYGLDHRYLSAKGWNFVTYNYVHYMPVDEFRSFSDNVKSIKNSYGQKSTVDYGLQFKSNVVNNKYSELISVSNPNVVKKINSFFVTEYSYGGFLFHLQKNAFVGCDLISAKNLGEGIINTIESDYVADFGFLPKRNTSYSFNPTIANSTPIINSEATFAYVTANSTIKPNSKYLKPTSTAKQYSRGVLQSTTVSQGTAWDSYGNQTSGSSKTTAEDDETKLVETTVSQNIKLKSGTKNTFVDEGGITTVKRNGLPDYVSVNTNTHYDNGLVKSNATYAYFRKEDGTCYFSDDCKTETSMGITDFAGNAVTTSYTYGAFGNVLTQTVNAAKDPSSSVTKTSLVKTFTYKPNGRFVDKITYHDGITEEFVFEEKFGALTSKKVTKGGSSFITTYNNDIKGVRSHTVLPDKTESQNCLFWVKDGDPDVETLTSALYFSFSEVSGRMAVKSIFDKYGRMLRTVSCNDEGEKVFVDSQYDGYSRNYRTSLPYYPGANPKWVTNSYTDPQNIMLVTKTVNGNDNSFVQTDYNTAGRLVITEGVGSITNQTKTTKVDFLGQPFEVISGSGTVKYAYNTTGKLQKVWLDNPTGTDAATQANTEVENYYDVWGNKSVVKDKVSGTKLAKHNAFGQIVTSSDESSNEVFAYNTNGTLFTRTVTSKALPTTTNVYTYTYKPTDATQLLTVQFDNDFLKTLAYDNFGRVTGVTEQNSGNTYNYSCKYDLFGRISSETFPNNVEVVYNYYAYSDRPKSKSVIANGVRTELFAIADLDQYNRVAKSYANNRTIEQVIGYHNSGNFSTITAKNLSTNAWLQNNSYIYAANGKLESKESTINNGNKNTMSFVFDTDDRLNNWTVNSTASNSTASHSITYDNFGNKKVNSVNSGSATDEMTYMPDAKFYLAANNSATSVPPNTTYTYGNSDRINTIAEPSNPLATGLSFTYGDDNQRRTMTINQNSTIQCKKWYFMNFEEVANAGEPIKQIYYLDGAMLVRQNGVDKLYFTLTDYDGSIQALVNSSNAVVEQYAYDPWGKRVNPNNWTQPDTRTTFIQDRGFTGHEHIDAFGIINMNARLYDPVVGIFMQPDPYMQDITNPINFNRYAYCLNNPLRYTDPTGEKFELPAFEWRYLIPFFGQVDFFITTLNDNTVGLRARMVNAGVPNCSFGFSAIPSNGGFDYNFNGNVAYTVGNYTFGISGGIGNNYKAWGLSFRETDGFGVGYNRTYYGSAIGPDGNSNRQVVGGLSLYFNDLTIKTENDFLADRGDRWRSGALSVSYKDFEIGFNVRTNENFRAEDEYSNDDSNIDFDGTNLLGVKNKPGWGKTPKRYGAWKDGQVYSSPIWIGMRSGINVARIGINTKWVQDRFQNFIHRNIFFGRQNFYNRYDYFDSSNPYVYSGFYNPYSLFPNN